MQPVSFFALGCSHLAVGGSIAIVGYWERERMRLLVERRYTALARRVFDAECKANRQEGELREQTLQLRSLNSRTPQLAAMESKIGK